MTDRTKQCPHPVTCGAWTPSEKAMVDNVLGVAPTRPAELRTTGDLLNILIPALEAAGVVVGRVEHDGFYVNIDRHLTKVMFVMTDPAMTIRLDGTVVRK